MQRRYVRLSVTHGKWCGNTNLNQDIEEDTVKGTMRFTENHAGKKVSTELLKTTFVERYCNHIPPPHTVTVRYYGLYSNQYSSQLEELQKEFPIEIDYEDEELVDRCPKCHTPMDIIKTLEPYEVVMSYEEFCNHDPPENIEEANSHWSRFFLSNQSCEAIFDILIKW